MPLLTELITDHCQSSLIGVVIDVPVLTHGRTPVDHMTNTLLIEIKITKLFYNHVTLSDSCIKLCSP